MDVVIWGIWEHMPHNFKSRRKETSMENSNVIYKVKGINKSFPGVQALDNVDFELRSGEIHGLVGHNGAGKSTLVKVLTGVHVPESGELILEGEKVSYAKPKDAIEKGIGIVTQEGTLISNFTGIQNIFLGQEIVKAGVVQEKALYIKGKELMERSELSVDIQKEVSELSPAQRKLVEILKIINLDPKIIIFDESTAALSDKERQLLFEIMRRFRDKGIGVIFITHYIDEILDISDRITVMRDGKVIDTVDAKTTTKQQIVKLMIDKEQHNEFPEYERNFGEVALEAINISDGKMVKDASIKVRRGEVIGLFGTVGAGRTEFGEALFGASKIKSGKIFIDGKETANKNVRQAIKNGMALIPDDRLKKALMLDEAVVDNVTLPFLKNYTKFGVTSTRQERKDAKDIVDKLGIRTPSIDTKVDSLSGGNKQKVSFGKWVTGVQGELDIYIFDEPTEGVDIGACAEMYQVIAKLVQDGAACIVISSDLTEVIGLSDRVYIMREGCTVAEFSRSEDDLHKKLISTSLGF